MPSTTALVLLAVLGIRHGVEHLVLRRASGGRASGRVETVILCLAYSVGAAGAAALTWTQDPTVPWMAALAWAALGTGVALRFWSRRALGRFYSYDTVVRDDHRLIDVGPFALVRHPLSAAMLLEAICFALLGAGAAPGEVWALAGIAPAAILAVTFMVRNRREEEKLAAVFGETYERYRRLLPGMNLAWGALRYCLRGGRPVWRGDPADI